ncbi:sulfotransferase family protein [Tropicibacter sp. S64]|uniref:sulfotransferase family protein n=1 Tax=Tropicibacter sp. S64 TaxID=3415122 RepID=UPI003C7BDE8D
MSGTFFLGLGGQKCGSSWIQGYLNGQSGSDFGRLGEYQVWEHALGGVFARYRVAEPSGFDKLRARAKMALGAPEPAAHLRWRLQADPEAYFDYFAALLDKPGIVRTGDITPSYAALPAETLRRIRDGFARRGIAVKVIFSMRDPVARLRSHLNMDRAKGYTGLELKDFYQSHEAEARSRYDLTLSAMDSVLDRAEQHVCLFEELFTPAGIAALSDFADVPTDPQAGGRQVNARAGASAIDEGLAQAIARHYAPAYRAAAERCPKVASLWQHADIALTSV